MSALFNGYYNGERTWREGVNEINKNYRIPKQGLIDIMFVGTEQDANGQSATFDEAIKKAETVNLKHQHKSSKNRWIDNTHFLIGRSWFYKRNYVLAKQHFDHVIKTWPESKLIPDVYLWLVRTHIMNKNLSSAKKLLDETIPKLKLKKRHSGELALMKAQILLQEENYDEVIRTLESNKKNIKGKLNKARMHFLLGQIYADKDQFAKSYEHFTKVTKINTDYEFIFQAKIRIARLFVDHQAGPDETKKLNRLLKKMLRDEKNTDFKDQIYYEIALLELKKSNIPGAIDNLNFSLRTNNGNQRQQALSYYKMGQIYFYEKKNFEMAEAYFDSASTSITKDAPEYQEISSINATLKEYVKHLNTIRLQDSLLGLSGKTDDQLKTIAENIIAEQKRREEEEQAKMLEEMNRLDDPNLFNQPNQGGKGKKGSGFYFDSPELVGNGRIEFQRVWGKRNNEDNWRRKYKDLVIAENEGNTGPEVSSEDIEKFGEEVAKLIANVPRTPEEIAAANQMVVEALYGLGQVYQNRLNFPDSAAITYRKLIRRYPDSEYAPKARYALYTIYKELDPYQAEVIKKEICEANPTGRYCRLANNELVEDEYDEMFQEYQSALTALTSTYKEEDYSTTASFGRFISTKFQTEPDLARIYYIWGLAEGYLGNVDSLKKRFLYVKRNYPEHEVTPLVTATLAKLNVDLNQENPGNSNLEAIKPNEEKTAVPNDPRYDGFKLEKAKSERVYAIMLVEKGSINSNQLQVAINDFNSKFFSNNKLNASIFLYNKKQHLAYISQFNDYKEAMEYINLAKSEESINALMQNEGDAVAFITPTNFRTAYGKKRFADYLLYFENVILKSIE